MQSSAHIILASGSAARKAMLENAGLKFQVIPADIDEDIIIKNSNSDIKTTTEKLAHAKALHISNAHINSLVIGSDQTLEYQGNILSKAKSYAEAEEKLKMLRGDVHKLNSSVCVAHKGSIIFSYTDQAELTMRDFSDEFLVNYMDKDPDALTSCVGGYKIEGAGAWLFSSVNGDVFTIMGMPLLPLLGFLQK